jgi:hypothetical protein
MGPNNSSNILSLKLNRTSKNLSLAELFLNDLLHALFPFAEEEANDAGNKNGFDEDFDGYFC